MKAIPDGFLPKKSKIDAALVSGVAEGIPYATELAPVPLVQTPSGPTYPALVGYTPLIESNEAFS